MRYILLLKELHELGKDNVFDLHMNEESLLASISVFIYARKGGFAGPVSKLYQPPQKN